MWKFYAYVFRARLKMTVTPSWLAAFFLLTGAVLALGLIFNQGRGASLRVGVLEPEAPALARVVDRVTQYAGDYGEIIRYTDEALLKQDVAAHKLECGYAWREDGRIQAYRSPNTVSDRVLDLLVAAAYVETMAGDLGAEVLAPYFPEGETAALSADLQRRTEAYLRDGALMDMIVSEAASGGETGSVPAAPYRRLFHGLLGLLGLLLALLCGLGTHGDARPWERFKAAGIGGEGYMVAGMGVTFLMTVSFMGLALAAGNRLYPGLGVHAGVEAGLMGAYALAVSGVSSLMTLYVRADMRPAVISFIFVFAALLGGTVFDIREVAAAWGFTRFFFLNYYYLDGITHASGGAWPRAAVLAGVFMVTGPWCLRRVRRLARG